MRNPAETFFVPLDIEANDGPDYYDLQRAIARSNVYPLKPLAIAAGILNGLAISSLAGVLRMAGCKAPDPINSSLGDLYFHVPEMVVHKRIELDVLAAQKHVLGGQGIDVGSGNGYVGGLLRQMIDMGSLHGVDPVESFEGDVAQHGYAGFSCALADAIPLPSAAYDFVLSICVMEHVKNLDGALAEAVRLLKPGGAFVVTTPAPEFRDSTIHARLWRALGFRAKADAAARRKDKISMQFHYASSDEWTARLKALGFGEVDVIPFFSRRQLIAYEVMNWSARSPSLYFPDKLHVLCRRYEGLRRTFAWGAAVVGGWIATWKTAPGEHTHWAIVARKPL